MAKYYCSGIRQYNQTEYRQNYGSCSACWTATWGAANADNVAIIGVSASGWVQKDYVAGAPLSTRRYNIDRIRATYDLSGLSPGDVEVAHIRSEGGWVTQAYGAKLLMYDGTGVGTGNAGYGEIYALTDALGEAVIGQQPFNNTRPWSIHFNLIGIAFLKSKAGGTAVIVFRVVRGDSATHPPTAPPGCYTTVNNHFDISLYRDNAKHWLSTGVTEGGYIWVEGDYLAYLDNDRTKRKELGSTTSSTGTVGGEPWVEGNYLHYIDSSGDERRILGSLTSYNTSKLAGQISINLGEGGTKLCYIDSSGAERSFEGT